MLFATYQSIDFLDKTDRPDYSIWALPIVSIKDFFIASRICAPNRSDVLIFFDSDDYIQIDKVAWYQAIKDCGDNYDSLNPMDYRATADHDALHSEYLVKSLDEKSIKRLFPILQVGDELDILGFKESNGYEDVCWLLRDKAREIINDLNPSESLNMAFGMSDNYAKYRAFMEGKKLAFECVYLPIAVESVFAGNAPLTIDIMYYSDMISCNFRKIGLLSDKFTIWSYRDCSLAEFDAIVEQMGHYVVDNPAITQRLRFGPPIGRNESCPCGNGKKWKKCHGLWLD